MRRLIVAGLVYLTGIAIVVLIKPQFMFREDGRWKEFGIGRDPANFTHFPFWLFAIIWSVIAYVIVIFLEDTLYPTYTDEVLPKPVKNTRSRNLAPVNNQELVPGYYMLNEGATGRNGVPRYVYLGPEEPSTT
jgi:hypothetical protein